MTVSRVENEELSFLVERLQGIVDFGKALPVNIFVENDLSFWFFERPLLCHVDALVDFISVAIADVGLGVYLKFSGVEEFAGSCYFFDGKNIDEDVSWVGERFNDFFGGEVGYPIILCNKSCDWVAFESSCEELGVIAVRKCFLSRAVFECLDNSFISMDDLVEMKSGSSAESIIANAFLLSYVSGR